MAGRNGKVDALILGGTTVAGLGKVEGVTKGIGGVTGYHFGVSGDGHIAFPAVVDGVEGYVVASPPALFATRVQSEIVKWRKVIQDAGIKPE